MTTRHAWKLLAAATALLIGSPALADVKAGVDAWARGDYPRALREWQGPADQGDPDALYNLGQAYKMGVGVKADLRKAEDLFGRAAEKGHLQAADIYGLLLFQRGERARAMPYVKAAADRGEPRAQYLLGVAHFNGDNVAKDWVRAYALTSLARQSGVEQARSALAQMDRFIPLEQRQQAAALAPELASAAEATRARQMAAADLGTTVPAERATAPLISAAPRPNVAVRSAVPAEPAAPAGADSTPRLAGADYARPSPPQARPAPPALALARQETPPPRAVARASAPPLGTGDWALQLGAFAVAANADALWSRVGRRPEIHDRPRTDVRRGKVVRMLATGFQTRTEAAAACARLTAAGFACLPVQD